MAFFKKQNKKFIIHNSQLNINLKIKIKFYEIEHVLANGPPTVADTPVNIRQRPKALVKFSRPSSSTIRMERSDAKHAAFENVVIKKKEKN